MELLIGGVIACVLVAAGWFFFEVIAEGSLDALKGGLSRRAAAEAVKAQKIRCGLRASSGRVHGIGTEWSVGIATLRSGSLSFAPSIGIVGDRQIVVLAVEQIRSQTALPLGHEKSVVVLVVTDQGPLECCAAPNVIGWMKAILSGRDTAR